ncbi:MAG: glycosyltransferase family 2 protein [Fischerella sp. CENA71]|nr:glycosyltransferase family 2 protein [Fischerella sp. CENA71]
MSLSTPVALIIFNRPDLTEKIFSTIAQAKPKKLFVIADGARFPEEEEKCQKTRAVIDKVDWECEVLTNFSDINLGCGRRPASGIDWVFSQVEEAIILEDDVLPSPSFFYFCQELLEYYRDDERIMLISGDNYQQGQSRTDYSYYFSKYPLTCGWASWRRAWKHYDYHMKSWPEFKQAGLLKFICLDPYEHKYWTDIFDQMYEDPEVIEAWDLQWTYTCFRQSGLCIIPNSNLISNLGFRSDATHITSATDHRANLPLTDIWEIQHPPFIVANREADAYEFDHTYTGKEIREKDKLVSKIRQKISFGKFKVKKVFDIFTEIA